MIDEREVLTWDKFGEACRDLTGPVWNSGFRPDVIVCVARGGLPPAGPIGYALDIKNLLVLNVEFYTGIGTTLLDPQLVDLVPDNHGMAGKRMPIVSDIAGSRRTLKFVHEICKQHVSGVRTAVFYGKPRAVLKYEYVWKRADRWIAFPWSALPSVNSQRNSEA